MMKDLVRVFHLPPRELFLLKLDDLDPEGLVFWWNDAKLYDKQIKEASKPKKK